MNYYELFHINTRNYDNLTGVNPKRWKITKKHQQQSTPIIRQSTYSENTAPRTV